MEEEVRHLAGERHEQSPKRQAHRWDKMMRGLSTLNYGAVVQEFSQACGIEKSAVSDNFI